MRIYSELTKKDYKTVDECLAAEKEYNDKLLKQEAEKKALSEKRAERAKEVEAAYKASVDAQKKYLELRNQFIEDYHSYHMTYSSVCDSLDDILESFLKIW